MNWTTYNSLTEEQKAEYNFRFKHKPKINFGQHFWFVFALLMYFIVMLAVSYLVMVEDENFIHLEEYMPEIISSMTDILQIILFVVLISFIWNVVEVGYYYSTKYWWRKKNKIEKKKDYFWRTR